MRISTLTFHTNAMAQMSDLQAALAKTQSQLGASKRIQEAADDPAGMAQVNQLNVQLSASKQYVTNGDAATANLNIEGQALTDATNLLQSARDLAVQANSASLTDADRKDIAAQLQQQLANLLAIANQKDANGDYLFSGYAAGTQPFSLSNGAVTYSGDQGSRLLQISTDQSISAGDSGFAVFQSVPSGNGTFTTAAAAANTGSGSIDTGDITDPGSWVPDTYTVQFTSATQWQVVNGASAVVASGTYADGGAIAFNGARVAISGTPAAGDEFTIAPAGSSDVFSTLSQLIAAVGSEADTPAQHAQLATRVGGAIQQLDNALDHLGRIQATVGARLNTIQAAQTSAQTRQTGLQTSISQLSDLDYAAAITQLNAQQLALQAAQLSYTQISKLSLFNYLA